MKFSRYLVWNFLKKFLIVTIGAIFMFAVTDFVGNIKTWLARDTKDAIDYYVSYIPYMLYLITPVSLFIAVLASVGNMARHLEMSAMQSSGQSPLKTLFPIFFLGVLASIGSYEMSELWLPDANHKRLEIMETNAQKKKNPRIKEKNDFTFIDSEKASWFFKFYSGKSKVGRDVVLLLREQGRLVERYDAKVVRWVEPDTTSLDSAARDSVMSVYAKESYWMFERGMKRFFNKDGSVTVMPLVREKMRGKVSTRPEDLINERTRAILICNPTNPTGYLDTRREMNQIRDLVKKYDLYLFSDEVYREFIYTGSPYLSAGHLEGIEQNVVLIDSVSKRYSECGIRIGALITKNQAVRQAVMKFCQARLSPPLIGQIAAEASLDVPEEYSRDVYDEYVERRKCLIDGLNRIPGVYSPIPMGAFYTVAKLPVDDSEKFCAWCLSYFNYEGETVMMAPASGFYTTPGAGHNEVRIAYVLKKQDLQRALFVLQKALEAYPGRTDSV